MPSLKNLSTTTRRTERFMHGGEKDSTTALKQQLQQVKQELRQAQSLCALGELVSTTSHEFNNVLTTILNYAKLGLRQPDEASRTKAFEKILKAAERANVITNGVLGMARNRSADPAPTQLAEVIQETLVLLEREMAKYRVKVEVQLAQVPPAMVVGNQIQQVLMNLMTNARQAMPRGGHLRITLAHDATAGTVDLSVRDSGTGIPPEQLPHIFDRGFSTKAGPDATGKGGAGLGLSACREIIESCGGRIRVESSVGRGTAFTLRLPAVDPATASPSRQPVVQLGRPAMVEKTTAT